MDKKTLAHMRYLRQLGKRLQLERRKLAAERWAWRKEDRQAAQAIRCFLLHSAHHS